MIARHRYLDGPLHVVLAADIGEIHVVALMPGEKLGNVLPRGRQRSLAGEKFIDLAEVLHTVDFDALHHGRFARVFFRDNDGLASAAAGFDGDGQDTLYGAHLTGEGEFADEAVLLHVDQIDLFADGDHRQGNGKIEAGAFLLHIGGCEIDGGPSTRPIVAAICHRRRDTVLAFFHGDVRKTDDDNHRLAAGAIDLDLDFKRVNAINGCRINFCQHAADAVKKRRRREEKREATKGSEAWVARQRGWGK